jgi:hypothetical protein
MTGHQPPFGRRSFISQCEIIAADIFNGRAAAIDEIVKQLTGNTTPFKLPVKVTGDRLYDAEGFIVAYLEGPNAASRAEYAAEAINRYTAQTDAQDSKQTSEAA